MNGKFSFGMYQATPKRFRHRIKLSAIGPNPETLIISAKERLCYMSCCNAEAKYRCRAEQLFPSGRARAESLHV